MTDDQLRQLSYTLPVSFEDVKCFHDKLPERFRTKESILDFVKFVRERNVSAYEVVVYEGEESPVFIFCSDASKLNL